MAFPEALTAEGRQAPDMGKGTRQGEVSWASLLQRAVALHPTGMSQQHKGFYFHFTGRDTETGQLE